MQQSSKPFSEAVISVRMTPWYCASRRYRRFGLRPSAIAPVCQHKTKCRLQAPEAWPDDSIASDRRLLQGRGLHAESRWSTAVSSHGFLTRLRCCERSLSSACCRVFTEAVVRIENQPHEEALAFVRFDAAGLTLNVRPLTKLVKLPRSVATRPFQVQLVSCRRKGRVRRRLPVAAKIALPSAEGIGPMGDSPTSCMRGCPDTAPK